MKILLVIDQFFSANNGMTISARRFAAKLTEHGNEVRIVSTGKPGDTQYLMPEYHVPVFDGIVTAQGMVFAGTDEKVLENAEMWADVVHFLVPFALSHHGIMFARKQGIPFTGAFHVQPENITSSIHLGHAGFINDLIYYWFNLYVFRYCSHIHCPSRFIAGELEKHGYKSKLHVISNGIDPDFSGRHKADMPAGLSGRFVILSVGRLSIEKRQDVTIRAISMSANRDRITLFLAGQGPRRKKLEKLARRLCVDVRFGFLSKQELINLIAGCDLYVHAADVEIEAMSCMEAFAGGLVPVIADSAKSATPQFALCPESLFRAGDPSDLAGRIDFWADNPEKRKEFEDRYIALGQKYDIDKCVSDAEDMFRQAIEETAGEGIRETESSDANAGRR